MIGIGSTLNQRFTLEKELGRGGMGAVYRATDQVLGRNVAIKLLKELGGEEVGRRIRLEAQILARLAYEHIVRLYDFGESEGAYFLVMEEVDGTAFSKRWRKLPMDDRLRVAAETAEALDYAHHQGVIHRDVKPANVLLTARDAAKLSDFGLSMMAEAKDDSGVVRGTPHNMSPEQAQGKRLDHRTDLYSLGVMLYECTTGSVPFQGQSMAVIAQHIGATPQPPRFKNPEISPGFESLILSLLSKDPGDRPASGAAVAEAIRRELAAGTTREAASPGATRSGVSLSDASQPTVARGLLDTPSGRLPSLPATPVSGNPAASLTGGMSLTGQVTGAGANASAAPLSTPTASTLQLPTSKPSERVASPVARAMLEDVLAEPMVLTPDERYLCGHYLAYLLGGSRRQGILLRRPLDPRNADRARLMLAMTWLMNAGPGEGNANVARAAELLDKTPDVRPALNPVVVMKYLASRDTPLKRKRFRTARKQLLEASEYARKHMVDVNGVLNPGLMPQNLEDLRKIAPERSEVDDLLVGRWNRVSEVWRENADFRQAVLRYATRSAHRDPCSIDLWPEVVYPLIERARWQRSFRPKHEQLWDYLSDRVLFRPDAGVVLDRMLVRAVPRQVADALEAEVLDFTDDPRLDDDEVPARPQGDERLAAKIGDLALGEVTDEARRGDRERPQVLLTPPDPYRFTQGEIRELWREAVNAATQARRPGGSGIGPAQRALPVGPYRLAVIPSIRGRSAGQVALQGMPNKQVEMLTPSVRGGGSSGKPIIAVWVYQDARP
ncbi:MAG: protein kinase [Isosphaeraceae bacterium]